MLGFELLRDLFVGVARPLDAQEAQGAWVAGLRVMAIDDTSLKIADTVANAEFFGEPGSSRGDRAAFPQDWIVSLADRGPYGFPIWQRACATGADLLWRVKSTRRAHHGQDLPDGAWLADIAPTAGPGWRGFPPMRVHVIEYRVDDQ